MTGSVTQLPRRKWRKFAFQGLAGAAFGVVFSLGTTELMDSGVLGALNVSQEIALLVGTMYILIGLLVAFGVALPRAGANLLNFEDEEEVRDQRRVMAWSAGSMGLMGVLLAMLGLSGPGGVIDATVALALTVAGWVVLGGASVFLLRNMDELMRATTREAGEVAYYMVLLACGGWALLAYLGFAPGMGMLDFITLNHVLLLLASFVAAGRRGMMHPR